MASKISNPERARHPNDSHNPIPFMNMIGTNVMSNISTGAIGRYARA